ncbi:LuxR C-terminal-related transcriptional regulator [Pseudonocardia sp. NPDC049154]|uniref:helix-turn-helix transcriptional regulator n=1 Tax=Pseudonocardia sp. NPDC049154 TaxID=3155501 RepID=UPI0033D8F6EC
MVDDDSPVGIVDRVVGQRLRQLQRTTGLPVVFGGATRPRREGPQLRIGHLRGTLGDSLRDLEVGRGRGLGGSALLTGTACRVDDYASTRAITHDFDHHVVREERMTSVVAVPVAVGGAVGAVVYGAVRAPHRIGDVVLDRVAAFGAALEREIAALLPPPARPRRSPETRARTALAELADLARTAADPDLRRRLARIVTELGGADPAASRPALAPRELDVLGLVALGRTNAEVADAMGLSQETVKAYLRSAMRRLDVRNRTAAVHAARERGLL